MTTGAGEAAPIQPIIDELGFTAFHARVLALVAGVILLDGFDIQLAAEGVERGEQMSTLENLGCDEMQGFLFSRPVDAEAATRLLNHFRPSTAARSLAPAAS